MNQVTLGDLQESVQDGTGFAKFTDYSKIVGHFLNFLNKEKPTRIVSPSNKNYIFFQFGSKYGNKITRPLNSDLFIESKSEFLKSYEKFISFLEDLKKFEYKIADKKAYKDYIQKRELNKVIYTIQQSIGCISDSFDNPNQSRKRVGQVFEILIKLIIQELGLVCEPRTVRVPIPGFIGYEMPYELDVVFSKEKAIITSETKFIYNKEIVGSIKTTSKDRIDKIFLDKYLLTKLLGRDIPVVAIFLHDVQRAVRGNSIFGINSTFKINHFLGYTVALNKLDGVYYVDPRPEMFVNVRLREQIKDFQQFLIKDLWLLSE